MEHAGVGVADELGVVGQPEHRLARLELDDLQAERAVVRDVLGEHADQLQREAVKVLQMPDIVARLALDGATPVGNTPQQFAQEIKDDIARWAKVIKAAGIRLN